MNLDLSICVVTYNCEQFIERFHRELLASLASHSGWELLYFDNSPSQETAAMLRSYPGPHEVFGDERNLGFSYGNNRLLEKAKGKYILLLNPDVFDFTPGFWAHLMSRSDVAGVRFIKLLNEDGSFQDCVGEVSSFRRALSRRIDYAKVDSPIMVGMGIMAFMLVSRAVIDRIGFLDESYPLYAEDMDWCYRAARAGVPIVYDPALVLTHVGGASATTRWGARASRRRKYEAERIFINNHYAGLHRVAMLGLNSVKLLRNNFL